MRRIGLAVVSFMMFTACTSSPPRSSDSCGTADYTLRTGPTITPSESCSMGQYWRSDIGHCTPIRDSGPVPLTAGACPSGADRDSASGTCEPHTQQEPRLGVTPPATTPPAAVERYDISIDS